MRTKTRRDFGLWVLVVGMAAGGLLAVGAAAAGTSIDRRIPISADGHVRVENVSGTVKISGSDRPEVVLTGTLGDGVQELRATSTGEEVVIEVVLPRNAKNVEHTDLVIEIPNGASVDVETVSASIEVRGVRGEHELESVSGAIDVMDGVHGIDAETVSGTIHLENALGTIQATSVSGAVKLDRCGGSLDAETTSGGLCIAGGSYSNADVTTLSGSIEMDADIDDACNLKVESFSGPVRMQFPENESARIAIATFSGPIANEYGAGVVEEEYGPGKSCDLVLGGGGAEVVIKSFSGPVSIEKRTKKA